MPALKPVTGVARVSCRGTSQGVAIVNVFHVKTNGGLMTLPDITYITNLVGQAYETNIIPRLNGNYSGDTVRGVDLTALVGQEFTRALAGTPGATSAQTPQNAACCITWKIARHYRGGHPRTYVGPLPFSAIDQPTSLAPAYMTLVQNGANAFLSAINAGTTGGKTMRLCAVHRWREKQMLDLPEVSDIQTALVDARIDTMRRRLGRDR
jgi:hypothetical protein